MKLTNKQLREMMNTVIHWNDIAQAAHKDGKADVESRALDYLRASINCFKTEIREAEQPMSIRLVAAEGGRQ